VTREESETVIRRLVDEWVEVRGVTQGQSGVPSFSDFFSSLQQDYSPYLEGSKNEQADACKEFKLE